MGYVPEYNVEIISIRQLLQQAMSDLRINGGLAPQK